MNVLDLFSGIGGFSIGLERAGMRTVAFCEIDAYCRSVLARHWPMVPIYGDVRELTGDRLRADGISVDVVAGGFPCQDVSVAGLRAGLAGERSGLWREFARLLGEVRPRFAIVENVAGLLGRGIGDVLGDLAALGLDAEWHCIPASAVGAPHIRDRVWIIAYPDADGGRREVERLAQSAWVESKAGRVADRLGAVRQLHDAAHAPDASGSGFPLPERGPVLTSRTWREGRAASERHWWAVEPNVGRVAHGVPGRVDRLKALGNAVVPQIPEIIGRAIVSVEASR